MLKRHLVAVLSLPFNVIVAIPLLPLWMEIRNNSIVLIYNPSLLVRVIGVFFSSCGFGLMIHANVLFSKIGKGTLSPLDPPIKFVTNGAFKYSRNPTMLFGVWLVLFGISTISGYSTMFLWTIFFVMLSDTYHIFFEESSLERRFGDEYVNYKRKVPRVLPSFKRLLGDVVKWKKE